MTSSLTACTLEGLTPRPVQVEVSIQRGLPNVHVVGLPDAAVRESIERIRGAFIASGEEFPRGRVTVALSPAEIRKMGASFDVPIALAILMAQGRVSRSNRQEGFLGELGLDGSVRPVRGSLPLALGLQRQGIAQCYMSESDARLAAHVPGLKVFSVRHLKELLMVLNGGREKPSTMPQSVLPSSDEPHYLDDLIGLEIPKRALLIAAAGGHHLLLMGPPGTGKTALARCLSQLLPDLSKEEQLEVNALWSLSGPAQHWRTRPAFRAPHHSSSAASLLGGGAQLQPGDISLAHRGVLFMDEFTEFRRDVVEQLRQPLEEGVVRLSRAALKTNYPARFQLICASNPCPCGYTGDRLKKCLCSPSVIERYKRRLSGPILDRIDLTAWVARTSLVTGSDAERKAENSSHRQHQEALRLVNRAKVMQRERGTRLGVPVHNADLSGAEARRIVELDRESKLLLAQAEMKLALSPRGFVRTLKVARTIADLAGREKVQSKDIAEALQFRFGMNR
jgi:magnesium chelatase family protein